MKGGFVLGLGAVAIAIYLAVLGALGYVGYLVIMALKKYIGA